VQAALMGPRQACIDIISKSMIRKKVDTGFSEKIVLKNVERSK
jgi:hypothetical protein